MSTFIRYVGLTLLLGLALVTLWNLVGAVLMRDRDEGYEASIFQGRLDGREVSNDGINLIQDWLENRTRPVLNPIKILREQLHYNAFTTGYDIAISVEPEEYQPYKEMYFLYQKEKTLFLRIETSGKNRVLKAEFSADELMAALTNHVRSK